VKGEVTESTGNLLDENDGNGEGGAGVYPKRFTEGFEDDAEDAAALASSVSAV
jgi:hypothetical protein